MLGHLIVAAETPNITDPVSQLYQFGAIGILAAILLIAAWQLFKKLEETLKLEREGRRRAEDELAKLNESIRDRLVPALERATAVLAVTLRDTRRGDLD